MAQENSGFNKPKFKGLYFILGAVPLKSELEEAEKLGITAFRNIERVADTAVEDAEKVAGAWPKHYKDLPEKQQPKFIGDGHEAHVAKHAPKPKDDPKKGGK